MEIKTKNSEAFELRPLLESDAEYLGKFFEDLSQATRAKFGPHPLSYAYASETLCRQIGQDKVSRFVVASADKIVGYFIVDFNSYPDEKARYYSYGTQLQSDLDPVFAPCIADAYQSQGIASQAMTLLLSVLKERNIRSLVLMGGTQEPNIPASDFYKKFGFRECGQFYTEHNGLNNFDMRVVF